MFRSFPFWFRIFSVLLLCIFSLPVAADQENAAEVVRLIASAKDFQQKGEHQKALAATKSALKLQQDAGVKPDTQTAMILYLAGRSAMALNLASDADQYQQDSLEALRSTGTLKSSLAASVNNQLAILAHNRGAFAVAIGHLRAAFEIQQKLQGSDHLDNAATLSNLAVCLAAVGQIQEANEISLQVLEIHQKHSGEKSLASAESLVDLCQYSMALGNLKVAAAYGKRALAIQAELLDAEHLDLATTLTSLGIVSSRQGDFTLAEERFRKALAILQKHETSERPLAGQTLIHLGQVQHLQGDELAASKTFELAATKLKRLHGPNHPLVAVALYGIAESSFLGGDYPAALSACDQARRISRNHFAQVLPFLTEQEQLTFIDDEDTPRFNEIISASLLLKENPAVAELAACWTLNRKGLAQEALVAQSQMVSNVQGLDQMEKLNELRLLKQQIAYLSLSQGKSAEQASRYVRTEELTGRADRLTKELALAGTSVAREDSWVELDAVRQTLAPKSVVLQFARFESYLFQGETDWGPPRYAAWVIPPVGKGDVVMVDLGEAGPIDQRIKSIRQMIAQAGGSDGTIRRLGEEQAVADLQPLLASLYQQVLAPLEESLDDVEEIILSPDGMLWLAPWAALPAGAGSSYMIEEFSLRYLISPSVLVHAAPPRARQPPLIFANTRFDLKPSSVWQSIRDVLRDNAPPETDRERSFVPASNRAFANVLPLPNTAIEAELISPQLNAYTGMAPTRYLEQFALETIVRTIQQPRVLVFGTHGFFLADEESEKAVRNPMARCGLLLAGCQDPRAGEKTAGDDGILTGMEIAGLNLRGTELVVLSACETAVGSVRDGEGVASLCQAFQLAGAQSIVATLWSVSDRESALLVIAFLERLAQGETKAAALQAAQKERIEKRRQRYGAAHPYFWAAFTLTGASLQ